MILVAGGSGFIGRHLINHLRITGHKVLVVSRSPGPERITWVDVERSGIPDGCKAVVNLSGRNILETNAWQCVTGQRNSYEKEIFESRVGTTKKLVQAIEAATTPPSVLVNASAIGYYNPNSVDPQNEDSDGANFDNLISPLMSEWENAARVSGTTRLVITRIGIVLGRDGGVLQNAYWPFFFGLGGPMGSGRQWFPWIHIEDMVGILRFAIFNTDINGVLNAVSPNCVTNAEFATAFGKVLNRPAFLPVPSFAMRLAYGDRAKLVLECPQVVPERTLEYGYEFKFPNLDDAMRDIYGKK